MSRWFRHYAGMMRDDKLVRVAIKSKQSIERVAWVWGAILESAAEIDDGGRYDFDAAEAAYFLRADEADIGAVENALAAAGHLAEGCVVKWRDRQFQSDRSATRQAAYRERKRSGNGGRDDRQTTGDAGVTAPSRHGDAPEAETDTEAKTETEEAAAAASGAAAAKIGLEEIEARLQEATGWELPGARVIAVLIDDGHSLDGRILPLARERAASRTKAGKPNPDSWAWLATIVADPTCQPTARKKRRDCSFAPVGSPRYAEMVAQRPKLAAALSTHNGTQGLWDYGALQ